MALTPVRHKRGYGMRDVTDGVLSVDLTDNTLWLGNGTEAVQIGGNIDGEQTSTSQADGGENVFTFTMSNGTTKTFVVKNGQKGSPGTPGAGVTISSKTVHYQASASGTTTPTGNWSTSVPSVTKGQYLWSRTIVTYSDGNSTTTYNVAYHGQDGTPGTPGTSVTVSSKSVTYQASTSGTTAPTGTWSTSVPTVTKGQYLWSKTVVTYSDENSTTTYNVAYQGQDGTPGTPGTPGTGVSISSKSVTYQAGTSGTTAPTGTWSTSVPSVTKGQYLWSKTVVTYSDSNSTTTYNVAYQGKDGTNATTTAIVSTSANGLAPKVTDTTKFLKGDGTWATPTDTKNTAGSTDSSSKLFLVGATSQAANPQTYSHDTVYVGTDGCLYSNSTKVSVEGHNQASNTINAMTGYSKGSSTAAIAETDSLNTAIGKLEKRIDGKGSGTVTQVKVGDTAYSPSSGVVSLPAYPSNTDRTTIKVGDTNITNTSGTTHNGVTLVQGSNVTLTPNTTDKSVTIAATNTWRPIGTGATDAAAGNHAHGRLTNDGEISSASTMAKDDDVAFLDKSDSYKLKRSTIRGFEKALIEQATTGTSVVTDSTQLLTSYASNNGFEDTHAPNQIHKRPFTAVWNYIKSKAEVIFAPLRTAVVSYNDTDGDTVTGTSNEEFAKATKSYVGAFNRTDLSTNSWRNMISARHRNGAGDGNLYGMYISSVMQDAANGNTAAGLYWNKESNGTWMGGRYILDAVNHSSYAVSLSGNQTVSGVKTFNSQIQPRLGTLVWGNINGESGSRGYIKFATIKTKSSYRNEWGVITLSSRNAIGKLYISLGTGTTKNDSTGYNNLSPTLRWVSDIAVANRVYAYLSDDYTLNLYWSKTEAYDSFSVIDMNLGGYFRQDLEWTWVNDGTSYSTMAGTAVTVYNNNVSGNYLPLTGGTVSGTVVLSKTTDAAGNANNSPALIVGGTATTNHIEIDENEIICKSNGTTLRNLYLNECVAIMDNSEVSIYDSHKLRIGGVEGSKSGGCVQSYNASTKALEFTFD